jgi:hypothetical protein
VGEKEDEEDGCDDEDVEFVDLPAMSEDDRVRYVWEVDKCVLCLVALKSKELDEIGVEMDTNLGAHTECIQWCNHTVFDLEGTARHAVTNLTKEVKVGLNGGLGV